MTRAETRNWNETMTNLNQMTDKINAKQFASACKAKFQLARELNLQASYIRDFGGGLLAMNVKHGEITVQFTLTEGSFACNLWASKLLQSIGSESLYCFGESTGPDAMLQFLALKSMKVVNAASRAV